jgi:hypothetical protein
MENRSWFNFLRRLLTCPHFFDFYTVIAGGLSFIHPVPAYGIAIFASLFVSLPWLKGKVVLPAE